MNIALFGGTFDPVHNAHLAIAREAAERFFLDRVLLIPAAHPPHKTGRQTAPFEHRLAMIRLACAGESRLEASDLDSGAGKSYSLHTISRARESLGSTGRLYFLIGADAFAEIETWYEWRQVMSLVDFIVVTRPGHDYAVPDGATVHRLDDVEFRVSSSEIRRRLAAGEAPDEVPPPVLAYIRQHGLYR